MRRNRESDVTCIDADRFPKSAAPRARDCGRPGRDPRQAHLCARQRSSQRPAARLVHGDRVRAARPHHRPMDGDDAAGRRRQAQAGLFPGVEFLIARLLYDALCNLSAVAPVREALAELGIDLDEIRDVEPDAALGNGGLGRLAACFMDSLATLGIAAFGYGIRYDHGLFRQHISDGWQQELPEDWLAFGNPWEFNRAEVMYAIGFGGSVEYIGGDADTARGVWYPSETVHAVAYDTPIVGWRGRHVNTLRLWSARATEPIHLEAFHQGDYVGALAARAQAEAI